VVKNLSAEAPFLGSLRNGRSCVQFGDRRCSVESENGKQGRVNAPLLFGREMTREVTQTPDIDGTDLFDEHVSRGAIDVDLGPERRRFGAG